MRVTIGDVRRIGDDAVVAAVRCIQPRPQGETDFQAQNTGVGLCHFQRCRANVGGMHLHLWPGVFQCQRDGTAAGAQIEYAQRVNRDT